MVSIVVSLNQKQKEVEEDNDYEMSILTAFETIRQLLQCSYSNTIVNNLLGQLEPLIVETFSSSNVELLSEVL